MTDIGYVNGLMEQVENCRTEETIMPMSCKCILDRMVFKGAMTEKEREKIMRNMKEYKPSVIDLNEERKTGKWIKDTYGNVICSECRANRRDNRIGHIAFCNSCGAKMEVEE